MNDFDVEDLCRASGLAPEDAKLLLQEVGGDLGLALTLVRNTLNQAQAPIQNANPAVDALRQAIDASSGDAASIQDLMASIKAFESGDLEKAVEMACAAHHPLWHKMHGPLLAAVDQWILTMRPGETESQIYARALSQGPRAVVLDVSEGGAG